MTYHGPNDRAELAERFADQRATRAAAVDEVAALLGLDLDPGPHHHPDHPHPDHLSYARFLTLVLRTLVDPGARGWRVGQAFFNVMEAQRPDLAAWLRASHADPFHHDERLPYVLRLVEARWHERTTRDGPDDGT